MRAVLASLVLFSAGSAQAQTDPSTTVSGVTIVAHRATPVAGVTVVASVCPEPDSARYGGERAPAVIDTFPAQGDTVAPGALVLRATFNTAMSCYWEVSSESTHDDDPCQPAGSWALPARDTWTMNCKLAPNTRYTIRLGREQGHGFVGQSGQSATPYVLTFYTSDTDPVPAEGAHRDDRGPVTGAPPVVTAYVTCSALPSNEGADCVRVAATKP